MKKIFAIIIFTRLLVQFVMAQHTGSWGDQGNETYKNPILESNYPDNDVIRVGDTFYMMSSTCHFVPGIIILKSKDLVNWQFSNLRSSAKKQIPMCSLQPLSCLQVQVLPRQGM